MAFEVTCGECGGQLLVESGGVVVECPLCKAHLSIPEIETETAANPGEPVPSQPVVAETTTEDSQILARVAPEPTTVESVTEAVTPADKPPVALPEGPAPDHTAAAAIPVPPAELISNSQPNLMSGAVDPATEVPLMAAENTIADGPQQSDVAATPDETTENEPVAGDESRQVAEPIAGALSDDAGWPGIHISETPTAVAPLVPAVAVASATGAAVPAATSAGSSAAQPRPESSGSPASTAEDTVPRQHFILVAGYASAATLALLYLLIFGSGNSKTHQLESLPDLVPEIRKDGAVGIPRVLPGFDLAPGHELQLGESQRFGNLKVTPVKVTRGTLEFVHAYGNGKVKKEPSEPVLKLWLKFENVSKGQEFPPLDRTLVYRRIFDPKLQSEFSLNFLCKADQRKREDGERHFLYDMPEFSEFNLQGQNLDHWLTPGETWETFIPSEEGLADLKGNWVWRVLFRKGLNPDSGRGVTTLIDVKFDGKQITAES